MQGGGSPEDMCSGKRQMQLSGTGRTQSLRTDESIERMFQVIYITYYHHWSGTSPDTINVNRWKYFRNYVSTG